MSTWTKILSVDDGENTGNVSCGVYKLSELLNIFTDYRFDGSPMKITQLSLSIQASSGKKWEEVLNSISSLKFRYWVTDWFFKERGFSIYRPQYRIPITKDTEGRITQWFGVSSILQDSGTENEKIHLHWYTTIKNFVDGIDYLSGKGDNGGWYNQNRTFDKNGKNNTGYTCLGVGFFSVLDDINVNENGTYTEYFGFGLIGGFNFNDDKHYSLKLESLWNVDQMRANGLTIIDEGNDEDGEYSEEEGYEDGSFDDSSDDISIPDEPEISVSSLGYLNVYKCNNDSLNGFIEEIFPQARDVNPPDTSNIGDSIRYVGEQLFNVVQGIFNSGLMNYVLDTHIIPVNPSGGEVENIKVGFRETLNTAPRIRNDYVLFDCGTINIPLYYANFIDLLTDVKLYLPFVGFVPIQPELCLGGSLNVKYRFNIIDGSFNAYITATSKFSKINSLVGTYSGSCCVHIPLASSDYSQFMSNVVGSIGTLATTGNTPLGLASGAKGMIQAINNPPINMSNGFNSTSGYLGCRFPYLLISRPVSSYSKNYAHENGVPLNVTKTLNSVHGYTVCDNPHIDNIICTEKEREEIFRLLSTGVILP